MSSTPYVPEVHCQQLAELSSLYGAVEAVSAGYDFGRHPYFLWASRPETDREAFRASQVPFRFAVEGWAQALSAVLARTPRSELRRGLVRNIADEHGDSIEQSHEASFERYLRALGAADAELRRPCPIAVRAFQQATTNFCLVHPYEAGAAALGIIEHLYIGISADIARRVVDRGWAAPGAQDHYAVHEELDVHHARELLDLARPAWTDARGRDDVALGLSIGAHHFWQLYCDLLPAR
ncbi:MAG: iron-containing redox enzyme family protein [Myxococcota bacterium]|nr:iron-containing redox enzyme family protein [Myxococcota bacterium]